MKKKLLAFALASVLTLGLSITSLAASVQAGVVTGISKVTDKDGNDVTGYIAITELTEESKKITDELKDAAKLKALLESLGIVYNEDMYIIDMKEVVEVGSVPKSIYPITVQFDVKGVTPSTKVIVLHYSFERGEWEVLESTVGAESVSSKFNSLSPVVFVVDGSYNTANGSGSTSTGTTSSTTSPTTGQTNNYMWAFAVIAIGVAGTVVLKKRA